MKLSETSWIVKKRSVVIPSAVRNLSESVASATSCVGDTIV